MSRDRLFGSPLRLTLLGFSLLGCAATSLGPALPPVPLPDRWEGPSRFELPRFRWQPGVEVVYQSMCLSAEETIRMASRQRAVGRHETGLTEVVTEIDGEESGRSWFNDEGRLVHATGEGSEMVIGSARFFESAYDTLERERPVSVAVPMSKLLPESALKDLPGSARQWEARGTLRRVFPSRPDGSAVEWKTVS